MELGRADGAKPGLFTGVVPSCASTSSFFCSFDALLLVLVVLVIFALFGV